MKEKFKTFYDLQDVDISTKDLKKFLFIIPARGGSKGVPRKNLRKIGNKSLLEHSVFKLMDAGVPNSNIVVSSEDSEIISHIGKHCVISFRPKFLAQDHILTAPVLLYTASSYMTLSRLDGIEGENIQFICLIQCTNLWLTDLDIKKCMGFIINFNEYDSLITVVEDHSTVWYVKDDKVLPEIDPRVRVRRQGMGRKFIENGAMYMCRKEEFFNRLNHVGENPFLYVMPKHTIFDIDSMEDFDFVKKLKESDLGF